MAENKKNDSSKPTNIWEIWNQSGIIDVLAPIVRRFYPDFLFDRATDISFGAVRWEADRGGWIGFMSDKIQCRPISIRWRVGPAFRTLAMVFDHGDGHFAVPIALAPASFRSKAEKAFKDANLLKGGLPGFRPDEWDKSESPQITLRFYRDGDRLVSGTVGKKAFLTEGSKRPDTGTDVVCEVVVERLTSFEVRWTGVTAKQFEAAERESARLGSVAATGCRQAILKELADPVAALGLKPEELTSGRIDVAVRRLRKPPTNEAEVIENPLAMAMDESFQSGEAWEGLYVRYLRKAEQGAIAVLRAVNVAKLEANKAFKVGDPMPNFLKAWNALGLDYRTAKVVDINAAKVRLDAVVDNWDNDSVVKAMREVEVPFDPNSENSKAARLAIINLAVERLTEALAKRAAEEAAKEAANQPRQRRPPANSESGDGNGQANGQPPAGEEQPAAE